MRVTKKVQEYIEKQVKEKVYVKYEAEKAEAERQRKIFNDFWSNMGAELERQAQAMVNSFMEANSDFIKKSPYHERIVEYCSRTLCIGDENFVSSVHKWHIRADREVQEIVDNIIVTLELGGSKADLDRMLSEI